MPKKKTPKHRNVIHLHAKRKTGAGVHVDRRRKLKDKQSKSDMREE